MKSPVEHIRAWQEQFTTVRRDLHAHPELGFEEHRTARIVCEQLAMYGIEHHAGIGRTGVVAVIPGRTNDSGKSIAKQLLDTTRLSTIFKIYEDVDQAMKNVRKKK